DTKRSVLNLEAFREMLYISPRIPNQPFADLPTEEGVLDFLRFLGHKTAKDDEEDKETGKGGDEVRKSGGESEEEEETSEEEEGSFDSIPRTPEDSEKESDDEE
nr:hypothetical protein [Tanacetum cinerariifolium]